MRRLTACVALAAGALLVAAPGAAAAKGGGAHYVVVPIFVPGPARSGGPYTPPDSVDMPLEVTDAPPAPTEGVVGLHDALARHTIRSAEAIVLDHPVQGRRRLMPAGTVLAKLFWRDQGRLNVLWCDMTTNHGMGGDVSYDCLSGDGADGKLTKLWSAQTSDDFLGFGGDEILRAKGAVDPPAPFHAATPEQRPTGEIGYEWCGGDNVATPARFEVSASFNGGFWEESESHACSFGAPPDAANRSDVQIDAVRVRVSPGPAPKTLAFKLEGRIAPGPIAHLEPGGPIRPLADAIAEAAAAQIEVSEQALVPTGAPARAAEGEVAAGEALYSLPVRHGLTGVLANDIWLGKYDLFGQSTPPNAPALEAGQPVYARVFHDAVSAHIVWCAPRKSPAGAWSDAVCFPSDGTGRVWVTGQPALLTGDIIMPSHLPPYVSPPIVTRGPVDFPPMTLAYVFKGWNKEAAKVETQVDWGDGAHTVRTLTLRAAPDGSALLRVAGGTITLARSSDPDVTQMTFQPSTPSDAAPSGAPDVTRSNALPH